MNGHASGAAPDGWTRGSRGTRRRQDAGVAVSLVARGLRRRADRLGSFRLAGGHGCGRACRTPGASGAASARHVIASIAVVRQDGVRGVRAREHNPATSGRGSSQSGHGSLQPGRPRRRMSRGGGCGVGAGVARGTRRGRPGCAGISGCAAPAGAREAVEAWPRQRSSTEGGLHHNPAERTGSARSGAEAPVKRWASDRGRWRSARSRRSGTLRPGMSTACVKNARRPA